MVNNVKNRNRLKLENISRCLTKQNYSKQIVPLFIMMTAQNKLRT